MIKNNDSILSMYDVNVSQTAVPFFRVHGNQQGLIQVVYPCLFKLNHRYPAANRKVLLSMGNAGCHPQDMEKKFININIVFLPANSTSKLQPLDLGIIQNFKMLYRKLFLNYVLARIDQCDSALEVANSITF